MRTVLGVSVLEVSVFGVWAVALVACGNFGESGAPNPVPLDDTSASSGASSGAGTPRPPTEPRRRTIERRSPVGSAINNFLVDGDFEFTATIEGFTAQSSWLVFGSQGQDYLRIETGGLCRTGLRCGIIESRTILLGRGASARERGMLASVYVKPPEGQGCQFGITVHTIDCGFQQLGPPFNPTSEAPGEDGWCRYERRVPQRERGTCLYVDAEGFTGRALIDEARLVPDDGTSPSQAQSLDEPWHASAQQRKRVADIAKWVRDHRRFGTGSSPAEAVRPELRRD